MRCKTNFIASDESEELSGGTGVGWDLLCVRSDALYPIIDDTSLRRVVQEPHYRGGFGDLKRNDEEYCYS